VTKKRKRNKGRHPRFNGKKTGGWQEYHNNKMRIKRPGFWARVLGFLGLK